MNRVCTGIISSFVLCLLCIGILAYVIIDSKVYPSPTEADAIQILRDGLLSQAQNSEINYQVVSITEVIPEPPQYAWCVIIEPVLEFPLGDGSYERISHTIVYYIHPYGWHFYRYDDDNPAKENWEARGCPGW